LQQLNRFLLLSKKKLDNNRAEIVEEFARLKSELFETFQLSVKTKIDALLRDNWNLRQKLDAVERNVASTARNRVEREVTDCDRCRRYLALLDEPENVDKLRCLRTEDALLDAHEALRREKSSRAALENEIEDLRQVIDTSHGILTQEEVKLPLRVTGAVNVLKAVARPQSSPQERLRSNITDELLRLRVVHRETLATHRREIAVIQKEISRYHLEITRAVSEALSAVVLLPAESIAVATQRVIEGAARNVRPMAHAESAAENARNDTFEGFRDNSVNTSAIRWVQ
jgi:hypothetical protein